MNAAFTPYPPGGLGLRVRNTGHKEAPGTQEHQGRDRGVQPSVQDQLKLTGIAAGGEFRPAFACSWPARNGFGDTDAAAEGRE
jgi:hypothetical protein